MAWAFWKYDTLPYFLGDKIESYCHDKNRVKLVNYGGMIVVPVFTIEDNDKGLAKWLELKKLGDCTRMAISMLKTECMNKAKKELTKGAG